MITPAIDALKVGATEALRAVVLASDGTQRTVVASWSSDAPSVVAVSDDGHVRGVSLGKTTIRARFEALAQDRRVRVVPDYGGTWDSQYRVVNCTRFSGPGSNYCRFVIGGAFRVRGILAQDHAHISGTIELYDNTGTELIETGAVRGSLDDSAAMVLTGTVSSVVSEQPGETMLSDWRTTLTEDGSQMMGRFAKNTRFRNGFGWQESREDCELVHFTRSPS